MAQPGKVHCLLNWMRSNSLSSQLPFIIMGCGIPRSPVFAENIHCDKGADSLGQSNEHKLGLDYQHEGQRLFTVKEEIFDLEESRAPSFELRGTDSILVEKTC